MRTPASICKLPIHPMLVVFPIGLWIFHLACDLIRLTGGSADTWSTVAFITMVGGLIGALGTAIPGSINLLDYRGGAPPVRKIVLTHMLINLTAVVLQAINVWLRIRGLGPMDAGMNAPMLLSIVCVPLIAVSDWLGGQIVHIYGVGVEGRE